MKRRHYCCIKNPEGMRPIFALIVFNKFVLAVDNTTENGLTRKIMSSFPNGVFKSFMKRRIGRFHVVKWTSTKWVKKRDARVELLFCSALPQLYLHVVVVAVAVVAYGP